MLSTLQTRYIYKTYFGFLFMSICTESFSGDGLHGIWSWTPILQSITFKGKMYA